MYTPKLKYHIVLIKIRTNYRVFNLVVFHIIIHEESQFFLLMSMYDENISSFDKKNWNLYIQRQPCRKYHNTYSLIPTIVPL